MGAALSSLGFALANQAAGELLIENWAKRDFRPIIEYCKTAEAFQEFPSASITPTWCMDQEFPGSKFILTVRNNSSEWYDSLTRFHTKIVGKNRLPTADDLKAFPYLSVGWLWRAHVLIYGCDESSLYDRELYTTHYESHRAGVVDYFRHRPEDLLVLNLSDATAMDRLCEFTGTECSELSMPHLNRSREAT